MNSFYRSALRRVGALMSRLTLCACALFVSQTMASVSGDRVIAFYHTHTQERLQVTYYRNGQYDAAALRKINHFLRDFRTGDAKPIDPGTIDIVHTLREQLGYRGDVHVVSAYRSPKTNEMLRSRGSGVARKSQHLEGKAIDLRFPGVNTSRLREVAVAMKRGGVGYYDKSDFIHVDTGRVRYW